MITRVGKLEQGEILHWRSIFTRYTALEKNPTAYSAAETEQIIMAYNNFLASIYAQFPIDETEPLSVCQWTGLITTGEE